MECEKPKGDEAAAIQRWKRFLVVALPGLLALGLAVVFFVGNIGSDDVGYAELAHALATGVPPPSNLGHHVSRVGLTVPLALIFSAFGISDWSLALLPLACTVATTVLISQLVLHLYGARSALLAGGLYAIFPPTIYLATSYLPEPVAIFALTVASTLFLRAAGRCTWYFSAGLLVGVAYLTTEAGVLMLGVMGIWVLLRRKMTVEHLWVPAGALIVFAGELLGHALVHGDPLYRFSTGRYLTDPMLVAQNAELGYRLLKSYPAYFIFLNPNFGAMGPLMLAGGLYGLVRFRQYGFFVVWAAVLLAFYNFMPVKLSPYTVLPADARLITPACLPLIVLAGIMLADVLGWAFGAGRFWRYALSSGVLALLCVVATVSTITVDFFQKRPGKTALMASNARLAAQSVGQEKSIRLASDPTSARHFRFYRGFNQADVYLRLEDFDGPDRIVLGQPEVAPTYVLLNMPALYEQELTGTTWRSSTRTDDVYRLMDEVHTRCALVLSLRHEPSVPLADRVFGSGWTEAMLQVARPLARLPEYIGADMFRCEGRSDHGLAIRDH